MSTPLEVTTPYTPFVYRATKFGISFIPDRSPVYITIPCNLFIAVFSTAVAAPMGTIWHTGRAVCNLSNEGAKRHRRGALVDLVATLSLVNFVAISMLFVYLGPTLGFTLMSGWLRDQKIGVIVLTAVFGILPIYLISITLHERVTLLPFLSQGNDYLLDYSNVVRYLRRTDYWLNAESQALQVYQEM